MTIQLGSLMTMYCGNAAVGHTFLSLNHAMSGSDIHTNIVVPNCEIDLRRPNLVEAVPYILKGLCYRTPSIPRALSERRFLSDLDRFDAAYLFPGTSQKILRTISDRNKMIFAERINCHTGKAKTILDEAYSRLGLPPLEIPLAKIEREIEDTQFFDFIFCPSPEVARSFEEIGVPKKKLISASYGWSPERFPERCFPKCYDGSQQLVVLFVGHLSVRKGTHLLLRAWEKAGITGKLILCGNIERAIATSCERILNRSDVAWHQYHPDIGGVYAAADVFAFPSLEEGSPLVTYEAMAHGLPALVSPMGAGGVVRNEVDGIVIPPYDEESWIASLRKVAASADLRKSLGDSARRRADDFTWNKVGLRRASAIVERMKLSS